MNFEIRKYNDSDLGNLIGLMSQLGYQHTQQSLSENICVVRESGGEIFVADSKGEVYGCICVIFDIHLAEGISGEIVSLVVDSSARGKRLCLLSRAVIEKSARIQRCRSMFSPSF